MMWMSLSRTLKAPWAMVTSVRRTVTPDPVVVKGVLSDRARGAGAVENGLVHAAWRDAVAGRVERRHVGFERARQRVGGAAGRRKSEGGDGFDAGFGARDAV